MSSDHSSAGTPFSAATTSTCRPIIGATTPTQVIIASAHSTVTGRALRAQHYLTAAMLEGSEREPQACDAYEFLYGVDTAKVGFVDHPTIAMAGASPDRLVGVDGLVEFKCPTPRTHLETLLAGEIPEDHRPQMRWQMACTGRAWCDFASWQPSVPPALRLWVKRLHRDDAHIAQDEVTVRAFTR